MLPKSMKENIQNGSSLNYPQFHNDISYILLDATKAWEEGFESYENMIKVLLDTMLEMHLEKEKILKQLKDHQNQLAGKDYEMLQYKAAVAKLVETEKSEQRLKSKLTLCEARLNKMIEKNKLKQEINDKPITRNVQCQTDEITQSVKILNYSNNTNTEIDIAFNDCDSSDDMISINDKEECNCDLNIREIINRPILLCPLSPISVSSLNCSTNTNSNMCDNHIQNCAPFKNPTIILVRDRAIKTEFFTPEIKEESLETEDASSSIINKYVKHGTERVDFDFKLCLITNNSFLSRTNTKVISLRTSDKLKMDKKQCPSIIELLKTKSCKGSKHKKKCIWITKRRRKKYFKKLK
ncbi:uncharacterized protein LOC135931460 [Gordionus sp. m RMFG-2023]|uniref:uncharacterized protein LOC135931460 n=1 Tax=Gordionus sp. m RMFG-2023 TaxID=3053472 RepID=UPI0031FE2DB6